MGIYGAYCQPIPTLALPLKGRELCRSNCGALHWHDQNAFRLHAAALRAVAARALASVVACAPAACISQEHSRALWLLPAEGEGAANLGARSVGRGDPCGSPADSGFAKKISAAPGIAHSHDADGQRNSGSVVRRRGPALLFAVRLSGCGGALSRPFQAPGRTVDGNRDLVEPDPRLQAAAYSALSDQCPVVGKVFSPIPPLRRSRSCESARTHRSRGPDPR